jgi:AcrR family transcriptional regulator
VSIAESRRSRSDHGDLSDRILDAAQRLVFRTGALKLSLSDVARLARVSRPTVYRYFASKEEIIDALGKRERRRFNAAMDNAMSGVVGVARLEAAVDVIATFVEAQPPGRLLDLEPGFAHEQMAQALPMLADGLMGVVERCAREGAFATPVDPRDLAGAIARTALSHYIFPDTDRAAARREIRAAAGLSGRG